MALFSLSASAQIVLYNGYNNATATFDPSGSATIEYRFDMDGWVGTRWAGQFQAPTGAVHVVEAVELPISHNGTLNLRMAIVPDAAGAPDSAALWATTNPPQITPELANRTVPAAAALLPGSNYWLVLEIADLVGSYAYWHVSSPTFAGIEALSQHVGGQWGSWNVGATSSRPAFRIHGRPVATPATLDLHAAVEVRFDTVNGSWYLVESADTAASEIWTPVGEPFMGTGGPTSRFHSIVGADRGAYRVWTE